MSFFTNDLIIVVYKMFLSILDIRSYFLLAEICDQIRKLLLPKETTTALRAHAMAVIMRGKGDFLVGFECPLAYY